MKTSAFSCREAISSQISASRANLPLSSGSVAAVAQQLAGVVAELLEPHQVGQHQAAPLHAVHVVQQLGQFLDQLGVQRRLPLAQPAERPDFDLVGQVGDDAPVGLQPPQDVRLHQVPQRRVAVLLALVQLS